MAHEQAGENEAQTAVFTRSEQDDAAATPLPPGRDLVPPHNAETFGTDLLSASLTHDFDLDFDLGQAFHDSGDGNVSKPNHQAGAGEGVFTGHPAFGDFSSVDLSFKHADPSFDFGNDTGHFDFANVLSPAAVQVEQKGSLRPTDYWFPLDPGEIDGIVNEHASTPFRKVSAGFECQGPTGLQMPDEQRPSANTSDGAQPPVSPSRLRAFVGKAIGVRQSDQHSAFSVSAERSKKRRKKKRTRSDGLGPGGYTSLSGSTRVSSSRRRQQLSRRSDESIASKVSSIQTWISHTAEHTGTSFYPGFHEQLNALVTGSGPGAFITPVLPPGRRAHVHVVANYNKVGHMSVGDGEDRRMILSRFAIYPFVAQGSESLLPQAGHYPSVHMNPHCVIIRSFSGGVINGLLASHGLELPNNTFSLRRSTGVLNRCYMLSYLSAATAAQTIATLSTFIKEQWIGYGLFGRDSSLCIGCTMDGEFFESTCTTNSVVALDWRMSSWHRSVTPTQHVAAPVHSELHHHTERFAYPSTHTAPLDKVPTLYSRSNLSFITRDRALPFPPEDSASPVMRRESPVSSVAPPRATATPRSRRAQAGYVPPPTALGMRYPNGFRNENETNTYMRPRSSSLHGADSSASNRTSDHGSQYSAGSNVSRKRKRQPRIEKGYGCEAEGCGVRFDLSSELEKHVKNAHAPPTERPYPCEHCDMAFLYPKDLRRHVRKKHPHQWALQTVRNLVSS